MQAECAHCRAEGYRECDECGTPVFPKNLERGRQLGLTAELCGYCLPPDPSEPDFSAMTRKQLREYLSEHG